MDLGAATLPDASTSNLPAAMAIAKSSATAPAPFWPQLLYDAAQKEWAHWAFQMPGDYASAPVVRFKFKMASATSGNVIVNCSLAAITGGDSTDGDAKAFATTNASSGIAVAGTAGFVVESTLALSNADSLAANDWVTLGFARDGASGSDTATGDCELVSLSLEYTTV